MTTKTGDLVEKPVPIDAVQQPNYPRVLQLAVRPVLVASLLFGVFASWSFCHFGNLLCGFRYLRGEKFVVVSPVVDLGSIVAGEPVRVDFAIKNLTENSVEIYGAQPSCSCVTPTGLPMTVGPFEKETVHLCIRPSEVIRGKRFSYGTVLHINVDHPPIVLTIRGKVMEGSGRQ